MSEPISAKKLAEPLGIVVLNYAQLNATISYLLWALIDSQNQHIGQVITEVSRLPLRKKIQMSHSLAILRNIQREDIKTVELARKKIDKLDSERNEIFHAVAYLFYIDENSKTFSTRLLNIKLDKRGALQHKLAEIDPKELRSFANEIKAWGEKLLKVAKNMTSQST